MMALVSTHQLKDSCSIFLSVPSSRSRESKVNQCLPAFLTVGRKDRLISLRRRPCLSVGTSLAHGQKPKLFKITAFKGSSQRDDSGGKANGSKSLHNHVKVVSYLQHESEEPSVDSSKVQDIVAAPYTESDDTTNRSMAIQNLFMKWLMLIRTPSQTREFDGALGEPSLVKTSEMPNTPQKQEKADIFKAALCYFWGLDATIKIPLLIFTPLYIAVNIMYGSEISKDLTRLWIMGPLITALYVKIVSAICGYYVFAIKQTFKTVMKIPVYASLVHEYIFKGKLKEAMLIYIWGQPLEVINNTDRNVLVEKRIEEFREWSHESYLDFREYMWPYYRGLLRLLRKIHLL
ncbi:embryo defective 2759 [Striga hermonthica]|uniref:Embryo defective 2759 n=1 Tax=Striga hermonthica TaxID=68872 RepID=A0A9N7NBN2_STRHE|nr:embryo defective 2759 [Striga hermonthica]